MGQLSNITQGISKLNMEAKTPQEREAIMWLNSVRSSAYENGLKKELLGSKIDFYGCAKEIARQYAIAEKEIPNIIKDYFGSNTSAMKDITIHICKTYVSAQTKAIDRLLTNDSLQKSGKDDGLRTYGTHTMPHIQCVMDKASIMIANRPNLTNEEIKTIFVSCLYHDTGMADARGLAMFKYEQAKKNDTEEFYKKIDKDVYVPKGASDFIRSYHSMTSGIEILRDRGKLEKLGINVDLCAMVAASHSKSNSGLKEFNMGDFEIFANRMSDLVDIYNGKCSEEEKIKFNKNEFLEMIRTPEGLEKFKTLSQIVSYADAFTHCNDTKDIENTNQLGEKYELVYIENPPIELMNLKETSNGTFSSNMFLSCDGEILPHTEGLIAEGFFMGEHNIVCEEKEIDGKLGISIEVLSGKDDLKSITTTCDCIGERILETTRFSSQEDKQKIEIIIDVNNLTNIKPEVFMKQLDKNIYTFIETKFEKDIEKIEDVTNRYELLFKTK